MHDPIRVVSRENQKYIVIVLCAVAAIRIFTFSAAFPFFCNTDEGPHYDTVYKYARGYLPYKGGFLYDKETSEIISFYGTLEYSFRPEDFPNNRIPPPLAALPREIAAPILQRDTLLLEAKGNYEAFSPPLYYFLTGAWYNTGRSLGIKGLDLLYWPRFFNIGIAVFLVWFSYVFSKRFYPDKTFLHVGLPLFAAIIPQDVFYSINSDVLSPVFFAISFYLLLKMYFSDAGTYRRYLVTGIFIAAAILTKYSNISILTVSPVILFLKCRDLHKKGRFGGQFPKILIMLLAIAAPVLLWIAQNHIYLEDWSGSAWKMKILGWSNKPLEQIWCHPIFTPNGMAIFWSDLMKSFWRGELTWHRVTLSSSLPDLFYPLSSAVFAIIAAINALANKSSFSKDERFVTGMCVWACLASIIYMAIISTLFDFGHCRNPSQDHPYFTSGRLILGALIPFLVLYVNGLWIILRNIRWTAVRIAIVLLVMILVTYPEIFIRLKIIRHPYNWFHRVPGYTCFK